MDRAAPMEKNLKFAMAGELLLAVLKCLSRRVFVLLLGREYLGLNGLFADVLSMLSWRSWGSAPPLPTASTARWPRGTRRQSSPLSGFTAGFTGPWV